MGDVLGRFQNRVNAFENSVVVFIGLHVIVDFGRISAVLLLVFLFIDKTLFFLRKCDYLGERGEEHEDGSGVPFIEDLLLDA